MSRRVTIMGLGRHAGGVAAARYLSALGARVTITDTADEQALHESLRKLERYENLSFQLGGHREEDFRDADLVVVNPAVRPDSPYLHLAEQCGVEITTEIDLFLQACPAPVIGVTGTNGKSTTAAMIAAVLRADSHHCYLGGNNGVSLLADLDKISPSDWVVLELSSFQLARLREETPGVQVAVVTGCTPNHLDWHGCFNDYVAAKQRLLTMQAEPAIAVLTDQDGVADGWSHLVKAPRLTKRQGEPLVAPDQIPILTVPGEHNRLNAVLAATAARAIGCRAEAIDSALAGFGSLPHRMEVVAKFMDRHFIDDSQATTPEAAAAALEAVRKPVWLMAGGHDKGADFAALARSIAQHAQGVCFYGAAGERMAAAVEREKPTFSVHPFPVHRSTTLPEAFEWCLHHSRPGDCLLLSPACASFDQFRDCEERAAMFTQLVRSLEPGREHPDCGKRLVRASSSR